jgi:transcriptional regulator with XRE-family HTH domain
MPRIRTLNPGASPLHFFGSEVRRAREAAGMTQAGLGALVPCDNSTVSRIEAGILEPDETFAEACDRAFPHLGGWFTRFYRESRGWDGPYPSWFEDWLAAEQVALALQIWQPIIVHGLLQTASYARALFIGAHARNDVLDSLVTARLDRQQILSKPEPANLWVVLDEMVLHRLIGSPEVMREQLAHMAELAELPHVSVQIVPASAGAHAGLAGAFTIATTPTGHDVMYIEAVEGQTVEQDASVRKASIAFDHVRSAALARSASREVILRTVDEQWRD